MSDDTRGPKERAYDEHFAPHVAALIDLAKEHGISLAVQAFLDVAPEDSEDSGPLKCSTWIPAPDATADERKQMNELRAVMYPEPKLFAFTITSGARP